MFIAGVSFDVVAADVIAPAGDIGGGLRREMEAEDRAFFVGGVEELGALDEAELFELGDDVVALPLFESGGVGQFRNRGEAFGLARRVCQLIERAADAQLSGA